MTVRVSREQVLRYRARASHLDRRLAAGSLVAATYAGLQDSGPRAGIIGLHARVCDVEPTSWEDPSLAQIWFRGGADYIIPRNDIGVFTLGASPRDPDRRAGVDALTDRVLEVLAGETRKVREVSDELALERPVFLRAVATSGRVLIRWNASMIWLIGCDRPDIDEEDARVGLARRFLRWFGPQRKERFAWWAAVEPRDATVTWEALAGELVTVELEGQERSVLEADVDALVGAEPIEGVRLIYNDDPLVKTDRDTVVRDEARRARLFSIGGSPGYIPGAVLIDGEVAGVWQRQQRRVTIHPWRKLPKDAIEAEALSFPIAGRTKAEVRWEPIA